MELIGSYSLLQRGRSYAELTRWMGQVAGETYPGLVVVGTVTDDFPTAVIGTDGKQDRDYVGPRLKARNDNAVASRAETGMRLIEREAVPLNPPNDADVNATVDKLRDIYSAAYGWDAPPLEGKAGGADIWGGCATKSGPPSTSGTCCASTRTPALKPRATSSATPMKRMPT